MTGTLKEIYNFLEISERIGTSGQPTEPQLAAIRDAGYEILINLLPLERETLPDEAEIVSALGMGYVAIPVFWDSPEPSDLEQFFAAMQQYRDRRIFVHCAANMRVSAFLFLYRTLVLGVAEAEAQRDLNQIWEPNPIWRAFIERMRARYKGANRMSVKTTGFLHMVYFWLKEGGTREDAEALANGCRKYLPTIPGVIRLEAGFPAGTDRDVVDNSYGVALLVEFADDAAHDVYQDHPDHLRFIEECSRYWSRVQVYDTRL